MFIQTEATPNPNTLKFVPGRSVLDNNSAEFDRGDDIANSPLAQRLFSVDSVERVFFGPDFISITKNEADWQHIKPSILGAIMDHYMSGDAVMVDGSENGMLTEEYDTDDTQIVDTIKELLDTRVRPAVAHDGGDIRFQSFKQGIVYLHMQGACAGCPSSTATLKHGIENLLKHFIPEVQEVRPV